MLAADLGATGVDVAVADLAGTPLAHRHEPIDVAAGPEPVLSTVSELFDGLLATCPTDGPLWGVGLGVPGPVEFGTGRVVAPPIMPGWANYPIRERLTERYDAPVWVDNDFNVLTLGELRAGAARGRTNALMVKLGTGIGAGIIVEGLLCRGAQGSAGDVGHTQVTHDPTVICRCGKTGCLEALAGGAALGYNSYPQPLAMLSAPYGGRSASVQSAFVQQHGDPSGTKSNVLNTFVPDALATGRLDLRPECYVHEITVDEAGRAKGVVYQDAEGGFVEQEADVILVGCGAIESARLLLLSRSPRFPEGVANGSGLVGRNLTLHEYTAAIGVFDDPVYPWASGGYVSGASLELHANDESRGFVGGCQIAAAGAGVPLPINFATPGEPRASDRPRPGPLRGQPQRRDRRGGGSAQGHEGLRGSHHRQLLAPARHGADGHHPDASVPDRECRAHELDNLYVIDGSPFPTSTGINPTLTIMANAWRVAEHVHATRNLAPASTAAGAGSVATLDGSPPE